MFVAGHSVSAGYGEWGDATIIMIDVGCDSKRSGRALVSGASIGSSDGDLRAMTRAAKKSAHLLWVLTAAWAASTAPSSACDSVLRHGSGLWGASDVAGSQRYGEFIPWQGSQRYGEYIPWQRAAASENETSLSGWAPAIAAAAAATPKAGGPPGGPTVERLGALPVGAPGAKPALGGVSALEGALATAAYPAITAVAAGAPPRGPSDSDGSCRLIPTCSGHRLVVGFGPGRQVGRTVLSGHPVFSTFCDVPTGGLWPAQSLSKPGARQSGTLATAAAAAATPRTGEPPGEPSAERLRALTLGAPGAKPALGGVSALEGALATAAYPAITAVAAGAPFKLAKPGVRRSGGGAGGGSDF